MANKTLLGIDIGSELLKLVLVSGNKIVKTAVASLPDSLVRDGRVVSVEAMSELIRSVMAEHNIRCKEAALVLSGDQVYVQNTVMPQMTIEQLIFNLPYEFRDYITDELNNYIFDYAMLSTPEELAAKSEDSNIGNTMELMAVAAPAAYVEELRGMLRRAGLKLKVLSPKVSSYAALIRAFREQEDPNKEYCILDIGYHKICMYMYRGDRHIVTRELDHGLGIVTEEIADALHVDRHLARTYLATNYDNCQDHEACQKVYNSISVELLRALNFYRFSNPESNLTDIWVTGGGATIRGLRESMTSMLDVTIHSVVELYGNYSTDDSNQANLLALAYGVTQNC